MSYSSPAPSANGRAVGASSSGGGGGGGGGSNSSSSGIGAGAVTSSAVGPGSAATGSDDGSGEAWMGAFERVMGDRSAGPGKDGGKGGAGGSNSSKSFKKQQQQHQQLQQQRTNGSGDVDEDFLAETQDDALSVLTGSTIDFGDCAGGHWTRQLLILKNTCEQFLDVHFSVEKDVEADFHLAELVQRGDEDEEDVLQEEPPPLLETLPSVSSASSAGISGSEEGKSEHGRKRSPNLSSDNLLHHNESSAAEAARTPTSYAHLPHAQDEPPYFALSERGSGPRAIPGASDRKGGRKAGCGLGKGDSVAGSDDEVDASSVASQAGSAPGSPVPPSQLTGDVVLEPQLASTPSPLMPNSPAGRGGLSDVGSSSNDGDRRLYSRPTSMLFSSRPSSSRGLFGPARTHDGFLDDGASARSDATAVSHDSRIGPFLSSTSHAGSALSSHHHPHIVTPGVASEKNSRLLRHGGAAALKGIRGHEQAHGNQIEELILRPGAEYRVIVSHRPARGELDAAYTHGRLQERVFRLKLDFARLKSAGAAKPGLGRERKTIQCRTRTCTSFISISPRVIDFGLANVGARKSHNFCVTNHSELTARVDMRFVSKVISMYRDEVAVPPLQSIELRVDFFPRRVNESYRKQVTVANLLNRSNDEILEVRSSNVDEQRISFHSLFYRILTSTGSNFIDFGDVNINCTRLRSFGIENVSRAQLGLELSAANMEDVKLYVKAEQGTNSSSKAGSSVTERKKNSAPGSAVASRIGSPLKSDGALADPNAPEPSNTGQNKASKAKRTAHLKERFLETLNQDVSASVRTENNTWRVAQKQSHFAKGSSGAAGGSGSAAASGTGKSTSKGGDKAERKEPKSKPNLNLVSALKKGGKGRLTQRYGKSITFKDRTLLSDFEYIDLATGPPVDGKRISAKSKKYQMLDANETGKTLLAAAKKKASAAAAAAAAASTTAGTDASTTASEASSQSTALTTPEANRRLPSALSDAIKQAGADHTESLLKRSSPALTGRRKAPPMLHDAIDVSKLSLDELVGAVEGQSSSLSTFFLGNPRAEEQSVRTEVNLQRELRNAIAEGRLLPVDELTLAPGEEKQVLAIYSPIGSTRPHIQGIARKQDSRIFIRLVDFDTSALGPIEPDLAALLQMEREALPVRDLMVKSNLCRSLLELSQPHINFGQMQKGETKMRKIVIQNRSEWALRYCIRKSGSIASGDIKLKGTDRYGVVPGHGRREVEFVFCPSLTGVFQERLTVENVADRDRDETVLIKANVTRVSNFSVEPASIRFTSSGGGASSSSTPAASNGAEEEEETLAVGRMTTGVQRFVVSNLSSKSRSFVVHIDQDELRHGAFHVEVILSVVNAQEDGVKASLSKAEEEEVEHISQKLKIASRKGHIDKVRKYHGRLTELGIPIKVDPALAAATAEEAEAAPMTDEPQQMEEQQSVPETVSVLKRVANSVTVTLAAQQSRRILVRLRPLQVNLHAASAASTSEHHFHTFPFDVRIPIQIHEVKNIDEVHIVEIRARIQAHAALAAGGPVMNAKAAVELPSKEEGLAIFSSQREGDRATGAQ